jgi:hypothetical protein
MDVQERSRSSAPVSRPTARRSPHKSPSPRDGGCGGSAVGRPAHRLPTPRHRNAAADVTARLAQRLQRRCRTSTSSGDSAAGVTPSAATGATVEPLRALQGVQRPGHGHGGCTGWRSGRTSAQRSPSASACSPSGPVHAQREGNRHAVRGRGIGPRIFKGTTDDGAPRTMFELRTQTHA